MCRAFFSHRSSFLFPLSQRGKYMYVAVENFAILLAIQNAIPSTSSLIRPHPLGVLLCLHRHLFIIQTYFCRSLIPPTSSRFPTRFRRESKTALGIYQPRNSRLLARHIAWPTWEFIRRNYAYEFVLDELLGCRLSRKFLNGCLELLRCK